MVPNAEQALIERAKLRDYLLSTTHPVGRFKATFFAALGYDDTNWERLESDLRSQHLSQRAEELAVTDHGRKYRVRARLRGPSSRAAEVTTVWIVLIGEDVPRFVTAYPGSAP